jgi:hypothetical protein
MLRIKVFLCCIRNTTRDYLDTAALWCYAGEADRKGLLELDALYPQTLPAPPLTQQACAQLADPRPADLAKTKLERYKELVAPWTDWAYVQRVCQEIAVKIGEWKLGS